MYDPHPIPSPSPNLHPPGAGTPYTSLAPDPNLLTDRITYTPPIHIPPIPCLAPDPNLGLVSPSPNHLILALPSPCALALFLTLSLPVPLTLILNLLQHLSPQKLRLFSPRKLLLLSLSRVFSGPPLLPTLQPHHDEPPFRNTNDNLELGGSAGLS